MSEKLLSLVVPVYFEQECINQFILETTSVLEEHKINYEIIFRITHPAKLRNKDMILWDICERIARLKTAIEVLDMREQHGEDNHSDEHTAEARFYQQRVIPAMNEVRAIADELEVLVDDSLWPLPKFREMLYIY